MEVTCSNVTVNKFSVSKVKDFVRTGNWKVWVVRYILLPCQKESICIVASAKTRLAVVKNNCNSWHEIHDQMWMQEQAHCLYSQRRREGVEEHCTASRGGAVRPRGDSRSTCSEVAKLHQVITHNNEGV